MAKDNELKQRLATYGLSVKDLSEEQLARAKRDCKEGAVDGFFSSNDLIRLTLKRR